MNELNAKNLPAEQNLRCINGRVREKNYSEINLCAKTIYYQNLANTVILDGNMKDVYKYVNSALTSYTDGQSANN